LRELGDKLALTILLITHEMDVVKAACDEVAIMHEGRVIEQGAVDVVFGRATTELARQFVRSSRELAVPEGLSRTPIPNGRPVLRVELSGQSAGTTLVSRLVRDHALEVAILGARTDRGADGASFGVLLLELAGGDVAVEHALAFLRAERVEVEVVGYVAANAPSPVGSVG
jgi:D-methionine transport system ATP-binding protein